MPISQNRRPSFHRRILPWIFIIAFLAIAPAVIFYTAGYRYNTKKGKVERYSTLIVDSTPNGAKIFLDGQDTNEVTPSTFQTVTPGSHLVVLQKDGYHDWQKNLEMDAQRATFASDIWLWKISDPELRFPDAVTALSASPDGSTLVRVSVTTSTNIVASDAIGATAISFSIQQPLLQPLRWFWSSDSKRTLVESSTSTWLIDLASRQQPLLLPSGVFRWTSTNEITGTNGAKRTTITLPDLAITQTTFPNSIFDQTAAGDEIRSATGTVDRIFVQHTQPLRGYVLPDGEWTFWKTSDGQAIFRDATHWLAVDYANTNPMSYAVTASTLQPLSPSSVQTYLAINNSELWSWDPTEDPQLIYRQSEPIISAAWHRAGHDIFFATKTHVYAISLDPRDGRIQTDLATFDQITDLTVVGKEVFIAGTKNDQTGVWALKVE